MASNPADQPPPEEQIPDELMPDWFRAEQEAEKARAAQPPEEQIPDELMPDWFKAEQAAQAETAAKQAPPEPAPTPAEPPPAEPPAAVREAGGILQAVIYAVAAAGLVVGGVFTGAALSPLVFPPPPAPTGTDDGKEKPRAGPPKDKVAPPGPSELRRIDTLIAEGKFAAALQGCRDYGEPGTVPRPVRYRTALCLEALGRPEEAVPHYQACVGGLAPPPLVAAGQLGLARVALQADRTDEARDLLCSLLARSAQPVFRSHPYQAEAAGLLALSLTAEVQGKTPPAATRPETLHGVALAWPVERYLDWATSDLVAERSAEVPKPGTFAVEPAGQDVREHKLTAALPNEPLPAALERVAGAMRLKPRWVSGASEAVSGRSVTLVCRGAAVADVLDWLTLPHGLAWDVDGSDLILLPLRRVRPSDVRPYQVRRAFRGLRSAVAVSAEQPLLADLYLALGNLEAGENRPADAVAWYERLARERPRAAALVPAFYNLGLLRLRRNDRPAARDAFFGAIDRATGNELTSLCHWWVGRTFLDEGDSAGATRALQRALQADPGSPTVPAAALGLACLSLLNADPSQAWGVLRDHRKAIQRPAFIDAAAFVDAYSRFQLTEDEARRNQATVELLAVVSPGKSEAWLGPCLPLLRGQAMRRLGLGPEMVALYDTTARAATGPLAARMEAESAEVLLNLGATAEARKRLQKLGTRQADLLLAQLDLREGKPEACLKRCRALLAAGDADRPRLLGLMSQAYSAQQDYARAAECLAGRVPAL